MSELINQSDCFWLVEGKSQEQIRTDIQKIEELMSLAPSVETPIRHYRVGRLYAREMFIPAGTVVVGKIHAGESLSICSMGDISVMTELGAKRIQAPFTTEALAGIKRVGFAHSDTVWVSIHETDCETIEEIEAALTVKSYNDLQIDSEVLLCHSEQSQGQ